MTRRDPRLSLFSIYEEGDRVLHSIGTTHDAVYDYTAGLFNDQPYEQRIDFEVVYDNVDDVWRGLIVLTP